MADGALVYGAQHVTVSVSIARLQVTISLVPEDLADFLRRHEEEYDAYDPTEDGVIEDQPHLHGESDTSED